MTEVTDSARRLDAAVEAVKSLDEENRAVAEEYALALEQLNREAIVALVRRLRADDYGKALLNQSLDDPSVRMLFAMYGIIRMPDVPTGVQLENLLSHNGSCCGGGCDCH